MAQEDYLRDSPYAQVAGALLSKKDDEDKDRFLKAITLSAITDTFKGLNSQLITNKLKAVKDVEDNYTDIFANNDSLYNNPIAVQNRQNYQAYLNNPKEFISDYAIELFNKNPNIRAELGDNAYSRMVNKEDLTEEGYNAALAIFNDETENAQKYIDSIKDNPVINLPTFSQYNQLAKNEFKLAVSAIEDDPTKKGTIRGWFSKNFGDGLVKQAELELAVEKAQEARLGRERLSYNPTPKEAEENTVAEILNANKDAANGIKVKIPGFVDIVTRQEDLKIKKINFNARINKKGYEFTIDDLHEAYEIGEKIPGIDLERILPGQRETLISAMKKAAIAKRDGIDVNKNANDIFDTNEEAEVYFLAMGTTMEAVNLANKREELVDIELAAKRNQNFKPLTLNEAKNLLGNENLVAFTKSETEKYLKNNLIDGQDYYKYYSKLSSLDKNAFVNSVLLSQERINRFPNQTMDKSFEQALQLQAGGITENLDKQFMGASYVFNNVNIYDAAVLQQDIVSDQQAELLSSVLNTRPWAQALPLKGSETENSYPEFGKNFMDGDYQFTTIQVDDDTYKWTWRNIGSGTTGYSEESSTTNSVGLETQNEEEIPSDNIISNVVDEDDSVPNVSPTITSDDVPTDIPTDDVPTDIPTDDVSADIPTDDVPTTITTEQKNITDMLEMNIQGLTSEEVDNELRNVLRQSTDLTDDEFNAILGYFNNRPVQNQPRRVTGQVDPIFVEGARRRQESFAKDRETAREDFLKLIGADSESQKERQLNKAEKYLSGERNYYNSTPFRRWLETTKGINSLRIEENEKRKLVSEFVEFLKQS